MKTTRHFTLLVAAGALLLPAAPAPAETALRTDTSGHLLSPLDLGDTHVTGTLDAARLPVMIPPTRLGTGTPSSTAVLRGDGSWVGTTSTGNTIASTSNLLMGDGAGNALAISSGADLERVFRARLDSLQASQALPVNLLPAGNNGGIGLTSGTINADGTMTVPANGSIQWTVYGDPAATPLYGYVIATSEQPADALNMHAHYGVDKPSTDTTFLPGAYRSAFSSLSSASASAYQIAVNNTTSSPITIYYPVAAVQDTGLALLTSNADHVAVGSQPVADLDFTRFSSADRSSRYQLELRTTAAADSVNGSGTNAGTLYAPTLALPSTITNPGGVLGLYRGSVFRQSLPLLTTTTHGVVVQDLALGSTKALPVVSALDPVNNAGIVNNGNGTYSIQWNPTETLSNDGYSNVYVVEINTATEAAAPIASRRRMVDVTSAAAVVSTPGSVYVVAFGGVGWLAQLHPTDGLTPGSGSYRYEVVSRMQPANWGNFDTNAGDGAMSGLVLVGGSQGTGELEGPRGFLGDRLVLVHATTHNAVINGGSLQRSVFYESGDTIPPGPSVQLAWYAGYGVGLRWDTRNCLFYCNVGDRFANGIISHTSGLNQAGTAGDPTNKFDRGDLSDTAFLGARWSDGSLHGTAIDYANVATGVIERVYVQAIQDAFGIGMPLSAEVRGSVFRQVHQVRVGLNFHDNLVLAESGNDPNNAGNRTPIACVFEQSGARATNNLFWARGVTGVQYGDGASGISFDGALSNCTFQRNVVVLNAASTSAAAPSYFYLASANLGTMAFDYNLVINLSKNGFGASGSVNYATWAAYQAGTGLDAHSLYVDLSADPRGMQAVFADPLNGDFRWAQTEVARRCAAFCAANHVGPATVTSRWPVVPTVDEAVRLLTDL